MKVIPFNKDAVDEIINSNMEEIIYDSLEKTDNIISVYDYIVRLGSNFRTLFRAFNFEDIQNELQKIFLDETYKVKVRMAGISNSYTMFIDIKDEYSVLYHARIALDDENRVSFDMVPISLDSEYSNDVDIAIFNMILDIINRLTIMRDYIKKYDISIISNKKISEEVFSRDGLKAYIKLMPEKVITTFNVIDYIKKIYNNYGFEFDKSVLPGKSMRMAKKIAENKLNLLNNIAVDLNELSNDSLRFVEDKKYMVKKL